jgi:Tol biopolymer transport system component
MTLHAGVGLSHYEVLGPLGAGAMGEVYRARDTKLGREVAIKVLPDHFADEPERLKRFEREAKTLATLNHTNVAQIFGVDQVGETCFLVLELVPGESLEARLKRGPLPLDEAIDVARQIAEGLEAAHEAGVIHRDLKPANVLVTPEGRVKVLDFGLAKPANEGGQGSSTDSVLSTEAGRLLGTPTYMAPEQARGKSIDKRVDIWAFGCVLYECLTAKRAFAGETLTDVLGSVLHTTPDLATLPAATPQRVHDLLARCFAKDPRQRLRDIGDARWILAQGPIEAAGSTPRITSNRTRALWAMAWIASLFGAVALAIFTARPAHPPPAHVVRTTLHFSPDLDLARVDGGLALSPDGRTLALCAARADEEPRIYVRTLDSLVPQALSGTEDAHYPFWSPDGRAIAFFAKNRLKRIPASGGAVTTICECTGEPRGGSWGPDDTIVFAPGHFGPLQRVSALGGSPTALGETRGRVSDRLPHFLPDGQRVLYSRLNGDANGDANGIWLLDLSTGASTQVSSEESEGIYVSSGALVFVRGGNLMAQAFDPALGRWTGEAKLLAESIVFNRNRNTGLYSISNEGTLVYLSDANERRLEWFDAEGRSEGQFGSPARFKRLELSPRGDRIVALVARADNTSDLQLIDSVRGLASRFVENAEGAAACWSPDGQSIAYGARLGASYETRVRSTTAAGEDRRIGPGGPTDWSNDAVWISCQDQRPGNSMDVLSMRADGSGEPRAVAATPALEGSARFSADGRWLVFTSDESGRMELCAVPFPGPGAVRTITSGGVSALAKWANDGRVFYLSAKGTELWSVSLVPRGDELEIGTPVQAFGGRELPRGPFSITADGQRIVIAVPTDPEATRALTLVQNWPAALGGE